MNITLIIPSLSCGGAERVMSILANYWAEHGENVTLITMDSQVSDFYTLNTRVNRVALDLKRVSPNLVAAIKNNVVRFKHLRGAIKKSKPAVVISFLDRMNVVVLVATRGLVVPVIVSEHTDPRQLPPGGIWNLLRRVTYSWAKAVVVLTEELRGVLSNFVPGNRLHVIPNPAISVSNDAKVEAPFDLPTPFIVAMGRLNQTKGFDLLLEAFSRCDFDANNSDKWSLVVLGEGGERENLESLVKELGLESRVFFPGNVKDPSAVLTKAQLFVMSSRFEGFPMALVEAMSCALPVISFDCPTGPNDIIRDGIDGVLVPAGDVSELASAIGNLANNRKDRERLGKRAVEVVDRFSIENVMMQWQRLLDAAINKRI